MLLDPENLSVTLRDLQKRALAGDRRAYRDIALIADIWPAAYDAALRHLGEPPPTTSPQP